MTAQGNITITGTPNPGNGKFSSSTQGGGGGGSIVANFLFNAGDTMAMVKGGMGWEDTTANTATPPGQTEAGHVFLFDAKAGLDPWIETIKERRAYYTQTNDVWVRQRFFIDSSYRHRRLLQIKTVSNFSTWQLGDVIRGADGVSTGTYEATHTDIPTGDIFVYLKWAAKDYDDATWVGALTNLNRVAPIVSTNRFKWPDNNKLFAFWCDDYSTNGKGATVIFEMRARDQFDGGSVVYYHFGADGFAVGTTLPNSSSAELDYILTSDFGTWFENVYHIKAATSEAAQDGIIEFWTKKQGGSWTKKFTQTNAQIGPRAAANPTNCKWRGLYLHGAANAGFSANTTHYDSEITQYSAKPAFLP